MSWDGRLYVETRAPYLWFVSGKIPFQSGAGLRLLDVCPSSVRSPGKKSSCCWQLLFGRASEWLPIKASPIPQLSFPWRCWGGGVRISSCMCHPVSSCDFPSICFVPIMLFSALGKSQRKPARICSSWRAEALDKAAQTGWAQPTSVPR